MSILLTSQVLTRDQENFGLALVIETAIHHKPLSSGELIRWAQVLAKENGTRTGEGDMRSWQKGFFFRVKKETGIDLDKVETQQLSKQRAGVLMSGVRAFAGMITSLCCQRRRCSPQQV